ncbi:MAG: hypothetical protein GY856_26165 [bacterium]|nr:hypothetical protein [bacterium]
MAEKPSKPAKSGAPPAKPEAPVETPAPETPEEQPKRRGRPPGSGGKRGRKPQQGDPDILFLVETEEGSGQFEAQEIPTTTELLDIIDMNRGVIATRNWRRF